MDATYVTASFEEDRLCLKSDHSIKSMSEPLCKELFCQKAGEYEIVTEIIEFAASTMGDVYMLSQTCK